MLPDVLVPFKHYPEETISGVLEDIVGPDDMDSENFPSEKSMTEDFIQIHFGLHYYMK